MAITYLPIYVEQADGSRVAVTLSDLQSWTDGDYGYDSGSGDATVDVPANARVTRVSVLGHASIPTTLTIADGPTITLAANGYFDEQIIGKATLGGNVVIGGGDSPSWYVAWVVEA